MNEKAPALPGAGAKTTQNVDESAAASFCSSSPQNASDDSTAVIFSEDERLTAFRRRCLARVAAVRSGRLSLPDTVKSLRSSAQHEGLTELFGGDEIEGVLGEIFAGWR
jgi:hypothetical protein